VDSRALKSIRPMQRGTYLTSLLGKLSNARTVKTEKISDIPMNPSSLICFQTMQSKWSKSSFNNARFIPNNKSKNFYSSNLKKFSHRIS
jgi:hypothetical protein